MAWNELDTSYIKEGDFLVDLKSVKKWRKEVKIKNRGKWGRPFRYSETLIALGGIIKAVFRLPNRQTEGFLKALSKFIGVAAPDHTTIGRRVSKLSLDIDEEAAGSNEPATIAVDASGVSVKNADFQQSYHTVGEDWLRLHVAVDMRKRRVLNIEVSRIGDYAQPMAQIPIMVRSA